MITPGVNYWKNDDEYKATKKEQELIQKLFMSYIRNTDFMPFYKDLESNDDQYIMSAVKKTYGKFFAIIYNNIYYDGNAILTLNYEEFTLVFYYDHKNYNKIINEVINFIKAYDGRVVDEKLISMA